MKLFTLRHSNMAMENPEFLDVFPIGKKELLCYVIDY